MGYDQVAVYREVCRLLSRQPGRTLLSIAAELRIDRHTIARDLRRVAGRGFRDLQLHFMCEAMSSLIASTVPLMRKEIADRLGLPSTRSLSAWMARLERDCSKDVGSAPEFLKPLHPPKSKLE